MSRISNAMDISDLGQSNLWVIYGKSGSGKTEILSTFPKPLLYIQVGDDGSNTIAGKEGIKAIKVNELSELKEILIEAKQDTEYATIAVDTFSLITNEWVNENAIQKNKRVTLQMWGEIKTETEELIKLAHVIAKDKNVVLTCHEAVDVIEGVEDEIMPEVRPNVSKGARTYLEGMANFGIHSSVLMKDKSKQDGSTVQVPVYVAHMASNPYYWVKTQKPSNIELPRAIVNPTYSKMRKVMQGRK